MFLRSIYDQIQAKFFSFENANLSETKICPACKAVFDHGSWRWGSEPEQALIRLCSACARTLEHHPAAILHLIGSFAKEHHAEVLHLIHDVEEREQLIDPMKRIMSIHVHLLSEVLVTFTDADLAMDIGKALCVVYGGCLTSEFEKEKNVLKFKWRRYRTEVNPIKKGSAVAS